MSAAEFNTLSEARRMELVLHAATPSSLSDRVRDALGWTWPDGTWLNRSDAAPRQRCALNEVYRRGDGPAEERYKRAHLVLTLSGYDVRNIAKVIDHVAKHGRLPDGYTPPEQEFTRRKPRPKRSA